MSTSTRRFTSLHNHTSKSLLDAISKPDQLVEQAFKFGFRGISFTEHGNMFSIIDGWKAVQKVVKDNNINPSDFKFIPGYEAYQVDDMDIKDSTSKRYHLILLAQTNEGLMNLNKIATEASTRGFYGKPRVDMKLLSQYSEGVICSSSCLASRLSRALLNSKCGCSDDNCEHNEPSWERAVEYVNEYKGVFGDRFYIELQCHDTPDQEKANRLLLKLAKETGTKYLFSYDSHMLDESQMDIHRRFIQISQDRDLEDVSTYKHCWQMSLEDAHKIMDPQIGYDAVEEAINTTDEIVDGINVNLELHQDLMPHIHIPEEFDTELDYLKHLINEGWKWRGINKLPKEQRKIYKERIENELSVLEYLGYFSYFFMLKQFTDKVREREIPLGYGRGSASGCLILYLLGVTEIDSMIFGLDFSRFANKGRKGSPADVDLDIAKSRRQEAIDIMVELFGRDNIANLATFNSLSPKVCIRDLGKIFHNEGIYDIPYSVRDAISKLIPDDPNEDVKIENALMSSDELRKYEKRYPLLFEYTKVLQNIEKSLGTHASAIIVGKEALVNYAPLMYNKDGNLMLQLEMHNAQDDIGLVKIDVLGLASLDVVNDTLNFSNLTWKDIDLKTLDLNNKAVLSGIYEAGDTLGIFQMESPVCQQMFKEIKPDSIRDIVAVASLNRPASLSVGTDKEYIYNKHHREEMFNKLIHPSLAPIFEPTYGTLLFQEQALKVFGLAGFDDSERDSARRAIGKKVASIMASLYEKFKNGLALLEWNDEQVKEIWKLIEAQSSYSFNEAHAASYAALSFVMAYLKYYYPTQFMTALLISVTGDYQDTTKYIQECRRMGIEVLPPDINTSGKTYSIVDGKILFGLEAIRGVGSSTVDDIIHERENGYLGEFSSLKNFVSRCKVDAGTLVALIKAGCFGYNKNDLLLEYANLTFGKREYRPVVTLPKKSVLLELNIIKDDAQFKDKELCLSHWNKHRLALFNKEQQLRLEKHLSEFTEKYMSDSAMYEFQTLNTFIVDRNPFYITEPYTKKFDTVEDDSTVFLGGTISGIKYGKQKNGARFARIELLTINDGLLDGVAFSSKYTQYQEIIKKGLNVIILARKSGNSFLIDKMKTLQQWIDDNEDRLNKKKNRGA